MWSPYGELLDLRFTPLPNVLISNLAKWLGIVRGLFDFMTIHMTITDLNHPFISRVATTGYFM